MYTHQVARKFFLESMGSEGPEQDREGSRDRSSCLPYGQLNHLEMICCCCCCCCCCGGVQTWRQTWQKSVAFYFLLILVATCFVCSKRLFGSDANVWYPFNARLSAASNERNNKCYGVMVLLAVDVRRRSFVRSFVVAVVDVRRSFVVAFVLRSFVVSQRSYVRFVARIRAFPSFVVAFVSWLYNTFTATPPQSAIRNAPAIFPRSVRSTKQSQSQRSKS